MIQTTFEVFFGSLGHLDRPNSVRIGPQVSMSDRTDRSDSFNTSVDSEIFVKILIILMAQRKIKLSETNRSILTRFPMHSAYMQYAQKVIFDPETYFLSTPYILEKIQINFLYFHFLHYLRISFDFL